MFLSEGSLGSQRSQIEKNLILVALFSICLRRQCLKTAGQELFETVNTTMMIHDNELPSLRNITCGCITQFVWVIFP